MYKKIILLLLAGWLHTVANAQTIKGQSWVDVRQKGSGTLYVTYYETPNLIEKIGNKYEGVCADIMQNFVKFLKERRKVNVVLKYRDGQTNFKEFYNNMKGSSGAVFGLGNITITEERKKEVSFSVPFMTNVALLVTQKSAPSLTRLNEMSTKFKGMKAYVAKGTTHEKFMNSLKKQFYPEMEISYTTSSKEALAQVLKDPKALCYQDLVIYFDAVEDKKPVKRHSVADRPGESFGLVMPPQSDWQPVFNEFLVQFMQTPEYRKILLSHLGADAVQIMDMAK